MLAYILRRLVYMVFTVWVISVISFAIIELPPGDYVTSLASEMRSAGVDDMPPEFESMLRDRYGLDQPVHVRYTKWISNIILHGDFGFSFIYNRPADEVIADRLGMTLVISLAALVFTWIVALPIGIYSAFRQYSILDYVFTFIGFVGLAIPNFLLALLLLYIGFVHFDETLIGLFSEDYEEAPWSLAKVWDLAKHLWIPVIIIGTAGTAGLIRTMRANLLDELNKPYVETARAKGMVERNLLVKYPVRHAMNPFVSTVGWTLPALVSGETIVAIVLNLPTTGPVLLDALKRQDLFLAAGFILLLSTLTVVGTLLSDIMLAWLDPRIRYQ